MILSHGDEIRRLGCTVKEYIKTQKLPVFTSDTRYSEFDDEIREGSLVLIGCGDPDKAAWVSYGAGSIAQVTDIDRGSTQYADLTLVNGYCRQYNLDRIAHINVYRINQCDNYGKLQHDTIGFEDYWFDYIGEEYFKYLRYIGLMIKQKASDGSDLYRVDRDRFDNLLSALDEWYARNDRGYTKSPTGRYIPSDARTRLMSSICKNIDALRKDTKDKSLPGPSELFECDYSAIEREAMIRFDGGDTYIPENNTQHTAVVMNGSIKIPTRNILCALHDSGTYWCEFFDMFDATKYFGPDSFEFIPAAAYIALAQWKGSNLPMLTREFLEMSTDLAYVTSEHPSSSDGRLERHGKASTLLNTILCCTIEKKSPVAEIKKWVEYFRGK